VRDVLVEGVLLRQASLERHELVAWITLKADKEQPGVELAPFLVHAVGEGVPAAQDLLVRVLP